jgi:Mor family transcriptional regulator
VQIDGEMARTVGTDATRTLASVWPSELVTIPRAAAYLRRERDRAIHREKEQLSIRKLALKYELTERTVFRILLDEPPAEPQLERSRASQYPLF